MSAHTPGPWTVEGIETSEGQTVSNRVGTYHIPQISTHVAHMPWAQLCDVEQANARLIAAAPRMLDLLKSSQVRLFMLDGANAEYEAIDALMRDLGVTNG